ncbi:MAG: hypothetical protein Q8L27_01770 [archaeon]|nr:hypothetical protein [archaeon]
MENGRIERPAELANIPRKSQRDNLDDISGWNVLREIIAVTTITGFCAYSLFDTMSRVCKNTSQNYSQKADITYNSR